MIADFAFVLVRLLGGFWAFRARMLARQKGSLAYRALRGIYYLYLSRYGAFIGHSAAFAGEPCFPHGLHGIFVAGGTA
jgi:hypothetical protein